jgi:hypothetical protein
MNNMKLNPDIIERISKVLGRNIDPSENGSIAKFSCFPALTINELRLLAENGSILAISYIRFLLKENVGLNVAVSYFSEVIQQGVSVEDWISGGGLD